jgi:hypothetical protein
MLRLLLASWLVSFVASAITKPTAQWQTLSGIFFKLIDSDRSCLTPFWIEKLIGEFFSFL